MAIFRLHARWLALAAVVTMASALLVFAPAAAAPQPPIPVQNDGPRQVFRDDLDVEGGQTLDGDVFVYDGDVRVHGGGRIAGNLVVFSGDVTIDAGGSVGGDVTAYRGDVDISGTIDGHLSCLSGDINLSSSARVEGDVSALAGDIERAEGAYVGGNVVQGPSFRMPSVPDAPSFDFSAPARPNALSRILQFFLRLIGAVLMTGLAALVAGVMVYARPGLVERTRRTLAEQTALSFVIGLAGNLTLIFLAGLLAVTICFLPLALIPMLAVIAVNVVGWTVASQLAGERIVRGLKLTVRPVTTVVIGAIVLTGIAAILWAFGGCFRPLGFLYTLAVSSFGTGAVVVPFINRRSGPAAAAPGMIPAAPPSGTPAESPATQQATPAVAPEAQVVEMDLDEPIDYQTAQEVNLEQEQAQEDDFTAISGIGPAFQRRLKAAGIRTYADLAALTPEQVAEIIGWPVERVIRTGLIEQAARLAQQG